jgi:hypothetical protein
MPVARVCSLQRNITSCTIRYLCNNGGDAMHDRQICRPRPFPEFVLTTTDYVRSPRTRCKSRETFSARLQCIEQIHHHKQSDLERTAVHVACKSRS